MFVNCFNDGHGTPVHYDWIEVRPDADESSDGGTGHDADQSSDDGTNSTMPSEEDNNNDDSL